MENAGCARRTERDDDGAMLLTCQAGYEIFLARELEGAGVRVVERGPGWVRAERGARSGSKVEGQRSNVGAATSIESGAGAQGAAFNMERATSEAGGSTGLTVGVAEKGGESAQPIGRLRAQQACAPTVQQVAELERDAEATRLAELAFAHLTLLAPVEVRGESVNTLAAGVAEFFFESLRGEKIEVAWPCVWRGPQELVGLGRRMGGVEAAFHTLLEKKLRRVARLATGGFQLPCAGTEMAEGRSPSAGSGQAKTAPLRDRAAGGVVRGLFVFFTDFGRAWVAREAWAHGQRRMADDDLAPSRSYLKMEEAYGVIGAEPQAGETVVDLGAAPGGWSYSAAKRGARVIAVDNGPLKGGALNHPLIEHRLADAFGFLAATGAGKATVEVADWLFCDVVEEPHHVLKNLVGPWLEGRRCRRFVVNFKLGRADPLGLLRELRAAEGVFSRHAAWFAVRHLYHDREEFTVVGESRGTDQ